MNRKNQSLFIIGLIIVITVIWAFPKIDQFIKVDGCLDQGGRWNYETNQCDLSDKIIDLQDSTGKTTSNEQSENQLKKINTKSGVNKKTENNRATINSVITNPIIDTSILFNIWTVDPNGPHADFWIKPTEFYLVDYDGNGSLPYSLNRDSLKVYYSDYTQRGRVVSLNKDTLLIQWQYNDSPTQYFRWN